MGVGCVCEWVGVGVGVGVVCGVCVGVVVGCMRHSLVFGGVGVGGWG